ncbi:copper amine oxidase N-terminal domain-containing protein [Paenibacillus sp. HWE-109]|uniref:stalk domain-containing protein n=1 Tax=Paenibacillus sp. HWE-109 TaxID=1306526 RepID=UPI001EDEA51B|nr:stalk domain-containing protein [Paenibacillus sp. HWE-109]UKS29939.1 copper amine oxidase N-terminal domain-containing protein [Paenibacillus sp. HWE-109]
MKLKKIAIVSSITFAFVLGGSLGVKADSVLESISAYLDHSVKIKLYGTDFALKDSEGNKLEAINYNGSTYLPLRSVAEATGMKVKWDEEKRIASLEKDSIVLANSTDTSGIKINVDGLWSPTYITNVKKIYSNWYMGVLFETTAIDNKNFKDIISMKAKEIKQYSKIIEIKEMNVGDLKGTYIDYEEPDSRTKVAFLESNNSKEYFTIEVFIAKNKYSDDNKDAFDQVISTFGKYR